jgi:secreted Zn-dependent insulinase-like peptidase
VFSSLFPVKKMAKLLRAHDKLQSSLNQCRDMHLQNGRLREYLHRMKQVQAVRKISLEAVEQLIIDRQNEKARARVKSHAQVKRFTRKKMGKRLKSMLDAPVRDGGV